MTPSPLSLRAFVHRFFVALVIGAVMIERARRLRERRRSSQKISKINKAQIDPTLLTEGGNYLIIGSDTRAFVDSEKDAEHFGDKATQTGQRSDTIMVVHIDPGKHTGILVSFPRDLWVDIPGHGTAKINAAFAFGGPQLTIATIKQDFNIPISHFLEVDFAGFRDIVNAIGSVPIYFPTPARDTNTGLDDHDARLSRPQGRRRARVRAVALLPVPNRRWSSGTTTRPPTSVASTASSTSSVRCRTRRSSRCSRTRSSSTTCSTRRSRVSRATRSSGSGDLSALVRAFRNTDPNAFPMYTLPATNAFRDSQSVLLLDDGKAAPMFARLRERPEEAGGGSEHRARDRAGQRRERVGRHRRGRQGPHRPRYRRVRARRARGRRRSVRLRRDRGALRPRRQDQGPSSCSRTSAVRASSSRSTRRPPAPTSMLVLGRDFEQVTAPADVHVGRAHDLGHTAARPAPRPPPVRRRTREVRSRKPAASTPPNISPHA